MKSKIKLSCILWIVLIVSCCGCNTQMYQNNLKIEEVINIPIKERSVFTTTTSENLEVPDDIYYNNNTIFILSSLEKKLVEINLATNNIKDDELIREVLKKQYNQFGQILEPTFIRVNENFKLICYDNLVILFDKNSVLVDKKKLDFNVCFVTIDEEIIYLWSYDFVGLWKIGEKDIRKIFYKETIYFSEPKSYCKAQFIIGNKIYYVDRSKNEYSVVENEITNLGSKLGLLSESSKYRININQLPNYSLTVVDKNKNTENFVKLPDSLFVNKIFYEEDNTLGLRYVFDDNFLYLLFVAESTSNNKNLILYRISW